jgi:hypothetical protein
MRDLTARNFTCIQILGDEYAHQMTHVNVSGVVIVSQYDGGGCWRYVIVEPDGTVGMVKENDNAGSLLEYLETLSLNFS